MMVYSVLSDGPQWEHTPHNVTSPFSSHAWCYCLQWCIQRGGTHHRVSSQESGTKAAKGFVLPFRGEGVYRPPRLCSDPFHWSLGSAPNTKERNIWTDLSGQVVVAVRHCVSTCSHCRLSYFLCGIICQQNLLTQDHWMCSEVWTNKIITHDPARRICLNHFFFCVRKSQKMSNHKNLKLSI